MILDAQTLLSDAQAITADAVSTNTYDTLAATNEIGRGESLVVLLTIDAAADFTTTDETYNFQLIQSANANLSSPDVLSSRAILASALTVGSKHYVPIPGGAKTKRYLGMNYDVGGTTPSFTVTADIIPASFAQNEAYYPDGITIS